MGDRPSVRRVRPYHWGAIYFSDAEFQEDFDIDVDGDGPVFATASHVAVAVTNARAVPDGAGDVTFELWVEDHPADGPFHEVTLDVASGRLYVGDAHTDDEVELRPGRWRLQFAVDDPRGARHVRVVLSPL